VLHHPKGRPTSLDLLVILRLRQPRIPLPLYWSKDVLVAHGQLGVCQDPQVLFCHIAFQQDDAQHILFVSSCRPLHFPCMKLLSAHFFSLLRSLWMAARPSGISAAPLSFVSSSDLPSVHSGTSPRSCQAAQGSGGVIIAGGVQKMCRYGTSGHGLADMVVLG